MLEIGASKSVADFRVEEYSNRVDRWRYVKCMKNINTIREGQKSESMQKCIEVMDKMMKPNQNELDFWRCAVNQGPL